MQLTTFESIKSIIITHNNIRSFLIASTILLLWVELMKLIANKGLLTAWRRRKIMHCLTGPIFLLTWPLFSQDKEGGMFAAFVPLFMTIKFLLIGLGILPDNDTIKSMSRSGNRLELLQGPLYYGIVFVLSTFLLWRQTTAIICIFTLCFGDGFAEIVGRLYGRKKLFWSKDKSYAGSIGFIFAGTISSLLFLSIYNHIVDDYKNINILFILRVLVVNIISAFVESLPINDIDNLTVFTTAIITDKVFTNYLQPNIVSYKHSFNEF